jgi:hypothetical protein
MASIPPVQYIDNSATGTALSISSGNFPAANKLGNTGIAAISAANTATTIASVLDTLGNLWLPVGAKVQDTTNNQSYWLYYAKNLIAGVNSVTATFNITRTFRAIAVFEFPQIDLVNALDVFAHQFQAAPGTGVDAMTGGPMLNTVQPALLFSFGVGETQAPNAGSGFFPGPRVWAAAFASTTLMEFRRLTDIATRAGTFTLPGATQSIVLAAIFKEAADALPTNSGGKTEEPEPEQRLKKLGRLYQAKGETPEEKQARRIAQGIEPDPEAARLEQLAADRAAAQRQVDKLKRDIERFEINARTYRDKVLASDAAAARKVARDNASRASRQAASLRAELAHLQQQEFAAEQLVEEFDIAVIAAMLAEA